MRVVLFLLAAAVPLLFACGRESPSLLGLDRTAGVLSFAPLIEGDVLVSEAASGTLRRIAGDGSSSSVFHSGISDPRGLAIEASGDVIVVEATGNLRRIAADGSSSEVFFSDMNFPAGVAVAANGDLIVTEDGSPFRLWRIAPDGSSSSVITDGLKSEDVEIDADGNFIVVDELSNRLVRVTPAGAVTVLFEDLSSPADVEIEESGDFVVAEFGSGSLRRIASDGSSGSVFFSDLFGVEGLAIAENGDLLASELSLRRIRRIVPDGSSSSVFFGGLNAPEHLLVVSAPAEVVSVAIDIKPGSDWNPINIKSRGVLLVAVLSSPDFDASSLAPESITLGDDLEDDTPVAQRRNGSLMARLKDVDDDGDVDLLLHFRTQSLVENGDLNADTEELILTGVGADGASIKGSDGVEIVPRNKEVGGGWTLKR